MQLRSRVLPRALPDALSVGFLLVVVPLIYWFELWVVLPALYQPGSLLYVFHFTLGSFLMFNIVGNFTYAVLCDTSARRVFVHASRASPDDGWRFCAECECLAPPRSWHCNTCGACILKRDHHCLFTGCCVGHSNQRYFLMFLVYMFLATLYAFVYNSQFIWSRIEFEFPMTLVKLVFPVAIFVFGFDGSINQLYLMLYIVTVVGMLFTGVLCLYQFDLVFKGCTAHEKNKKNYVYSLGWRQNIREVFGNRWYLVWLLPYLQSKLPQDGVTWRTKCK
ncbi:probable palmitoyltransferase ZDHHC24 [Copidosoma floridanum]|uniref:probable palmitoyltransferase ZDHHC24 n=1 Tax=Copidosoma floridanum TaxID=29053 RepID=UPI0006C9E55F|nr:probable palmitoyltransferase ZDHHC24 [Copidosoma floridanum]